MSGGIKSAFKPFLDEFEKIGSQTAQQAVQAVKQVASDVVVKPVQETVGSSQSAVSSNGTGTNETGNQTQQQITQQPHFAAPDAATLGARQIAKMQADDQQRAQAQIAQVRQNLKALMAPPKPPPEKPIYYKMWEEMEKKKQEKAEKEYIAQKEKSEVAAVNAAGKSTGERKKGIGG